MHLPAQSLIYTLLISLIVSTLLGGYVLVNYYQLAFLHRLDGEERARENQRSGLLWYLHQGWNPGEAFETDLFDAESDHVSISSEPWGLLGLFHVQGRYNQTVAEQSCLVGQGRNPSMDFSLSLTDQRQPLVVVGNTKLEGKLPDSFRRRMMSPATKSVPDQDKKTTNPYPPPRTKPGRDVGPDYNLAMPGGYFLVNYYVVAASFPDFYVYFVYCSSSSLISLSEIVSFSLPS